MLTAVPAESNKLAAAYVTSTVLTTTIIEQLTVTSLVTEYTFLASRTTGTRLGGARAADRV